MLPNFDSDTMDIGRAIKFLGASLLLSIIFIGILNLIGFLSFSTEITGISHPKIKSSTLNTVLGVILGFGASTFLNLRQENRKSRNQAINTRKALISELESMNQFFVVLTGIDYSHSQSDKFSRMVATTAYESNLPQIGNLTPVEVRKVVSFYSALQRVRTLIEMAAGTDPEDTISGEVMGPDERTASLLNSLWHSCIEELRNNIPPEERPPERELEVIEAEDSMESIRDEFEELLRESLDVDVDLEEAVREADEAVQADSASTID